MPGHTTSVVDATSELTIGLSAAPSHPALPPFFVLGARIVVRRRARDGVGGGLFGIRWVRREIPPPETISMSVPAVNCFWGFCSRRSSCCPLLFLPLFAAGRVPPLSQKDTKKSPSVFLVLDSQTAVEKVFKVRRVGRI